MSVISRHPFWHSVPKEEASNSSSSRMSSRLCIDLGMPVRASPFRFSDGVFCVLRRFKPEEVSSTLRAFLWLKTAFRAFWRGCGSTTSNLASLDALYGLGTWERWCIQEIVVPFCSKKVGTDISRNFSVPQPDSKNLVPFLKTKMERTKPAYSRGISSIVPFVPLFYKPLFTREEKREIRIYKKVCWKKLEQLEQRRFGSRTIGKSAFHFAWKNWNIYLRAPLFPLYCDFFA